MAKKLKKHELLIAIEWNERFKNVLVSRPDYMDIKNKHLWDVVEHIDKTLDLLYADLQKFEDNQLKLF